MATFFEVCLEIMSLRLLEYRVTVLEGPCEMILQSVYVVLSSPQLPEGWRTPSGARHPSRWQAPAVSSWRPIKAYRMTVLSDLCADLDAEAYSVLMEKVFPR